MSCSVPALVAEVLPPRTSITCAAPTKTDPALGRGLLDVLTTVGAHGGYVSDLRLSVKGQDARVTGVNISYELPEDVNSTVKDVAEDVSGDIVTGDLLLAGEEDDLRVAVLENVELVPRDLAVELEKDEDLGLSDLDFQRLTVTITPLVEGTTVTPAASTFAIDLCEGCLVQPPSVCSDDGEFALSPVVCRAGQDTPLFVCTGGGAP